MEPTLHSNNVLITEKVSARRGRLDRGDIIVARNPNNPRQFICKRVVGMPGDTVLLHSAFSVNPFAAPANSIASSSSSNSSASAVPEPDTTSAAATALADRLHDEEADEAMTDTGAMRQRLFRSKVVVVPRGHVWLEGDNAANSLDSRQYGPIPLGLVRSRAVGRVWPPSEMCLF